MPTKTTPATTPSPTRANLESFLAAQQIDLDAFARMLTRVIVVAPVNQNLKGRDGDPYMCLLSNRADLTPSYLANFDDHERIDFTRFVQRFRPSVGYRVSSVGKFQRVDSVIPRVHGKAQEGDLLGPDNLLLCESTATSRHRDPLLAPPTADGRFLGASGSERGFQVFAQIRAALRTLSEFLPRLHELHLAFSKLLSDCLAEHELPPYAEGQVLAPGLVSLLTELLFDEDEDRVVALGEVDFTAEPWSETSALGRQNLTHVVSAFRDVAVRGSAPQWRQLVFSRGRLSQLAQEALDPKLRGDFASARNAHGRLKQILRAKPLISMVLQSILNTYYTVVVGKDLDSDKATIVDDNAVRDAILEGRPELVAEPFPRPSEKERQRFSDDLREHFGALVDALVAADEGRRRQAIQSLPAELARLARDLAGDDALIESLTKMCPPGTTAEAKRRREAFLNTARMLIVDKVCPALYQMPVLTWQMLRERLLVDVQTSFISALFLTDERESDARAIGDRHAALLAQHVESRTQRIVDTEGRVEGAILADLMALLVDAKLVGEVCEYERVLASVHDTLGASQVPASAFLPSARQWVALDGMPVHDVCRQAELVVAGGHVRAYLAAPSPAASGGGAPPPAQTRKPDPFAPEIAEELALVVAGAQRSAADAKLKGPAHHEAVVDTAARALVATRKPGSFGQRLHDDLVIHEQGLALIFERYAANRDAHLFRQRVERMLLESLMLQEWQKLGLGEGTSNLYLLLIDLVLELDPEHPEEFVRRFSLTRYFDQSALCGKGITHLREILESQALTTFSNVVNFVSEVRGIQFLCDKLAGSSEAELLFANATAKEFLDWVVSDNLTADKGRGRLRAGWMRKGDGNAERAFPPCVIYFSHTAFGEGSQEEWLRSLAELKLCQSKLAILLPPLCLSLPEQHPPQSDKPREKSAHYSKVGDAWLEAAADAPAPVYLFGPSPHLNHPGSGFPTFLPAGYVFLAHLLGVSVDGLDLSSVPNDSRNRKLLIGHGMHGMSASLASAMRGSGRRDDGVIGFDADYLLYVALELYATAYFSGSEQHALPSWKAFLENFDSSRLRRDRYHDSLARLAHVLGRGKRPLYFAIDPERQATARDDAGEPPHVPVEYSRWLDIAARKLALP